MVQLSQEKKEHTRSATASSLSSSTFDVERDIKLIVSTSGSDPYMSSSLKDSASDDSLSMGS